MSVLDDIVVLLGRALTTEENSRAPRLIEIAESALEAAMPGFSFATGTETADILWHDPDVFWTPRYPVSAVHELVVGGATVDPAGYRWDEKGRIELLAGWPSWVVNGPWIATGWPIVTVDYDFGLDPAPAVMAGIAAQMAATVLRRQATNPTNVASETIGSYSVSYGTAEQAAAAVGMVVPAALPSRWRRNVTASVPMVRYR